MAYKALVKAACKSDWETGNFTHDEISKNRGIPVGVIRNWSLAGKWVKGKLIPQVQIASNEKTIETFARNGFTKDDAAKKLIECINEAKRTVFEGKGEQMIATPESDWDKILKALEMFHKLIDNYPAQKVEISGILEINQKILSILVDFRDALPEGKREEFVSRIQELSN